MSSVPTLAGVDGCRAGWLVVLAHPLARDAQAHQVRLCASFAEVLHLEPAPTIIAVDIPIGLLAEPQPGGRDCDRLARQWLGRRASSVFTPPIRPLLDATHYEHVRPYGVSVRPYILPKFVKWTA
jgi:predicted RNase H-like nuclease